MTRFGEEVTDLVTISGATRRIGTQCISLGRKLKVRSRSEARIAQENVTKLGSDDSACLGHMFRVCQTMTRVRVMKNDY